MVNLSTNLRCKFSYKYWIMHYLEYPKADFFTSKINFYEIINKTTITVNIYQYSYSILRIIQYIAISNPLQNIQVNR